MADARGRHLQKDSKTKRDSVYSTRGDLAPDLRSVADLRSVEDNITATRVNEPPIRRSLPHFGICKRQYKHTFLLPTFHFLPDETLMASTVTSPQPLEGPVGLWDATPVSSDVTDESHLSESPGSGAYSVSSDTADATHVRTQLPPPDLVKTTVYTIVAKQNGRHKHFKRTMHHTRFPYALPKELFMTDKTPVELDSPYAKPDLSDLSDTSDSPDAQGP